MLQVKVNNLKRRQTSGMNELIHPMKEALYINNNY